MSSKFKSKKHLDSDSDSDYDMTFTRIKKIYKCGICDKKIKNYCKCTINTSPHSGSNIITIMTNPDNDNNKQKDTIVQKGEKGDRGLTGSMGLPGNSFIFFTLNYQVNSGDFVGIGTTDKDFFKQAIMIPYDFQIKQIGFTIKNQINSKCTATLYVNNKPTDYIICVCDGNSSNKNFNSIIKLKTTDLFCFKIQYDSGNLLNGVCITMVIN